MELLEVQADSIGKICAAKAQAAYAALGGNVVVQDCALEAGSGSGHERGGCSCRTVGS